MLILGVFEYIGDTIQEMIVGLFLLIDSLVYSVISWLYQIFCVLASFRLFDNSIYKTITSSIFTIIGVVALFIVAYQLIQYMINPDDTKHGEGIKKMILKIISSMIMIVLVPTLFDFMFDFQDSILGNNVIGKLILPTYNTEEFNEVLNGLGIEEKAEISDDDYNYYLLQYYGNSTATQIFQAFFYPTGANVSTFSDKANDITTDSDEFSWFLDAFSYGTCFLALAGAAGLSFATGMIGSPSFGVAAAYCASTTALNLIADSLNSVESSLSSAYNYAAMYGDFAIFQMFSQNIIDNEITYHYLLSTIVGVVVAYILILYCLDLGVRAVKLAFYQIVAPLPIFMRILPKQEKVFDNWWKAVLSTYMEIFIRIFILYFAVLLISNLPSILGNVFNSSSIYKENILIYLMVRMIIILGILIFVKKMPKLIEEVTGFKSGNFSLNILDHIKEAAWAPAAVGGLIAGRGNPLAMIRAGAAGWKNNNLQGIGAEVTERRNLQKDILEGSTFGGRMMERGRKILGLESKINEMNRKNEEYYDFDTKKQMEAVNNTGTNIGILDDEGNIIDTLISDGDSYTLTTQSVETLKDVQANNAIRKQEIIKEGSILSGRKSQNEILIAAKKKLEDLAEKEIRKSKFRLKDDKGNDLRLEYRKLNDDGSYQVDAAGNYVYETIDHSNLAQFEEWFDVHKERMSSEDLIKLSDIYKKSVATYTKEAFINSNGMEEQRDRNGNVILDASGNLTYNQAHEDTLSAKRDVAFDMINRGFARADGTAQNDTYDSLINSLRASGINVDDSSFRLEDHITIDILKALKDEGEALNRGEIADQERLNNLIKSRYEEQNQAIENMLNQGKIKQEAQKQSKMFRANRANANNVNGDKRS